MRNFGEPTSRRRIRSLRTLDPIDAGRKLRLLRSGSNTNTFCPNGNLLEPYLSLKQIRIGCECASSKMFETVEERLASHSPLGLDMRFHHAPSTPELVVDAANEHKFVHGTEGYELTSSVVVPGNVVRSRSQRLRQPSKPRSALVSASVSMTSRSRP